VTDTGIGPGRTVPETVSLHLFYLIVTVSNLYSSFLSSKGILLLESGCRAST
jgi:hypothetical protein